MSFLHLHFKGRTTSPWHVGKRRYSDCHYTRTDYLWGRGVRGPVLRQLWRTFCPRADSRDGATFSLEKDCPVCKMTEECPFYNLIGSDDEGEFKDKPRLIITNLRFTDNVKLDRIALATLDDRFLSVVKGKAPVFVECLLEGVAFEFEVILMAEGVRFADQFESAVRTSLSFLGWGGFCNEGFGRGLISDVGRCEFSDFESRYIDIDAKRIQELAQKERKVGFAIQPLLILDKDSGGFYGSVFEEGFLEKLGNCVNERFWQFFGGSVHVQEKVEGLSGKARSMMIPAWSRRFGRRKEFTGVGNELTLHFKKGCELGVDEARALAVLRYGVGRFKNQGFGSLWVV